MAMAMPTSISAANLTARRPSTKARLPRRPIVMKQMMQQSATSARMNNRRLSIGAPTKEQQEQDCADDAHNCAHRNFVRETNDAPDDVATQCQDGAEKCRDGQGGAQIVAHEP